MATPKHFPGFGAVDADPHYELASIGLDLDGLEEASSEIDLFINDEGRVNKDIRLDLPVAGEEASVQEIDLAAGVRESPGIRYRNAVFTLRIRLTLEHVA